MTPVKLYVYDLSNGLAQSLSLQLTGKQIDGIWHTSVVIYGKEVYYGPYNAGPGIQITAPGRSHHGQPLRIEDVGETNIDEDTFMEYIADIQEMYTGEKYHLLDFNCNGFTNDCVGFLTGGSIPSYIKDLPNDFLSTPFGASLRPTIDNMYRRHAPGPAPGPNLISPLAGGPSYATNGSQSITSSSTLTSPIQNSSNPSSFEHILESHKAVVAYFTSDTCPPCRMIKPIFQQLAEDKASNNVAFVEVNFSHGMSSAIGSKHSVSVTPTFLFFLDGKRVSEMKGVNAPELKSQVDLLLYEAFPPHPHTKLELSALSAVSLNPILFSQLPPSLDAAKVKFLSFIDELPEGRLDKKSAVSTITAIIDFLSTRFADKSSTGAPTHLAGPTFTSFSGLTLQLLQNLPPQHLFPLFDLWRLLVLDEKVVANLMSTSSKAPSQSVIEAVFKRIESLQNDTSSPIPRSLLLTFLRLAANCFVAPGLIMAKATTRQALSSILVLSLLHEDSVTTTAAASVAFNVAVFIQKPRFEAQKSRAAGGKVDGSKESNHPMDDPDWEAEIMIAIVESLRRETKNEGIVHRLAASLGFFIYLSPFLDQSINPMLEALQVKDILNSKVAPNGPVAKKDVKSLVQDVATICL